jgi:hypothetical protein
MSEHEHDDVVETTSEAPVADAVPTAEATTGETRVETVNLSVVPGPEPSGDADSSVVDMAEYFGFNEEEAKRFTKKRTDLAVRGARLYGGKLKEHVDFGRDALDYIMMAKRSMDAKRAARGSGAKWEAGDFVNLCDQIAALSGRIAGIGKLGKKGDTAKNEIRVAEDIRAYLWCKEAHAICGDAIKDLPWSIVANYFSKTKMFAFSGEKLAGSIRENWIEFTKRWVAIYKTFGEEGTEYAGETDFRGTLSQAITDWEEHLDAIKNGNKTAEQIEQEAATKRAKETTAVKTRMTKRLGDAIADSLNGVLSPQEVADIVATTCKTLNVDLPLTTKAASMMEVDQIVDLLGNVVTPDDTKRLCKTLFAKNKVDVLESIRDQASWLIEFSKSDAAVACRPRISLYPGDPPENTGVRIGQRLSFFVARAGRPAVGCFHFTRTEGSAKWRFSTSLATPTRRGGSMRPLQTFSFLPPGKNTTMLLVKAIAEMIEQRSMTGDERRNAKRFLVRYNAVLKKYPRTIVTIFDATPTKLSLVIWEPKGMPSGTSPILVVPASGGFTKVLQALGKLPRMGSHHRPAANDTPRKVVVLPKTHVQLIPPIGGGK